RAELPDLLDRCVPPPGFHLARHLLLHLVVAVDHHRAAPSRDVDAGIEIVLVPHARHARHLVKTKRRALTAPGCTRGRSCPAGDRRPSDWAPRGSPRFAAPDPRRVSLAGTRRPRPSARADSRPRPRPRFLHSARFGPRDL